MTEVDPTAEAPVDEPPMTDGLGGAIELDLEDVTHEGATIPLPPRSEGARPGLLDSARIEDLEHMIGSTTRQLHAFVAGTTAELDGMRERLSDMGELLHSVVEDSTRTVLKLERRLHHLEDSMLQVEEACGIRPTLETSVAAVLRDLDGMGKRLNPAVVASVHRKLRAAYREERRQRFGG